MSLSTFRVSLHIFLLTFIVFTVSDGQNLTITPDTGTTVNIFSTQAKGCKVCRVRPSRRCFTFLPLKNTTVVEFECPKPHDVFKVEIVRNIECTIKSCSGHIIQADSASQPLLDFNRKFIWNLKASALKAFKIDFTKAGLRQINPSEICPERHTYTLQAAGNVAVGKYCRSGIIASVQILKSGSFSLDVPAGQKLQNGQFDVSVGEEIKSLAKITLTFPDGTSSTELLSPNYPSSFPDDDVMEWYFQVPEKHKMSVQFLNLTQPHCLKKETAVEYRSKGRAVSVLRLMDPQPDQNLGNVSMTLRNCEMDKRRSGSPGLSINLRVTASSASLPVSCKVDMSESEGLTLHIEKLRPVSECKMKINSVTTEKITVSSNSDLSFQDCSPEDVQVTALRVIACSQLKDCPKTSVPLLLPVLPSCLPAPLSIATWTLRPPQHGTVELASPTGPLRQSLPGQPCNDSINIKLREGNGTTIGDFCSQGSIEKVQIHTNMSVTLSSTEGKAVRISYKHVLNATFKGEISETYIFTVSLKKDNPVLLATPGWPTGMKGYSTVSWIVSVPPNMEAHLKFANLSQPKCSNHHTDISVQRVGRSTLDYSRREDDKADSELTVFDSFYLNMSNCKIERGHFSVISNITLQLPKNKTMLPIILSVVAALLVIFVIVVIVVCVVIKKKKEKLNHQTSIYNPNGINIQPGHSRFPKTRADNESHVYATIDETLIYTHLLKEGAEVSVYRESDSNSPATGHANSQKPLISKDACFNDMEVGVYQPFEAPPLPERPQSRPLVDNEIYQTAKKSEEELPLSLGPRLEPEGGN
ncbi:CUB domain-containing protein 1 [Channa argus]|uniref:CUB domain-containing protein 1 n=1 Tax=Channa argus TaxID=215402 RepID=A0A6G1PN87_CHAAH|nr:CUB domain-containing protein 1 [Channa argus]KAK2910434.1 hypothetical protein Q8A73_008149 [Channa argus]